VGNYRRKAVGAYQTADFFDPKNEESSATRAELADAALTDMIAWLELDGEDSSVPWMTPTTSAPGSPKRKSIPTGAGVGGPSCVAVYDATNSTFERRRIIMNRCAASKIKVFFIENICDDNETIMKNIMEVLNH
jgi:6-phosphofructo-2-kinase/fructose-2,6-biphosphatase 2